MKFDEPKCEFSLKNSSFKCWLFSPIFVADTKIISRYDIVALLIWHLSYLSKSWLSSETRTSWLVVKEVMLKIDKYCSKSAKTQLSKRVNNCSKSSIKDTRAKYIYQPWSSVFIVDFEHALSIWLTGVQLLIWTFFDKIVIAIKSSYFCKMTLFIETNQSLTNFLMITQKRPP